MEHRLVGSDGVIELTGPKGFGLRMWGKGQSGWTALPDEGGINGGGAVPAGIGDLIDALKAGREPELSGRRALRATELIFAAYESSRRRGRVDLPLSIDDSPLADLIERRDAAARTEPAEKV